MLQKLIHWWHTRHLRYHAGALLCSIAQSADDMSRDLLALEYPDDRCATIALRLSQTSSHVVSLCEVRDYATATLALARLLRTMEIGESLLRAQSHREMTRA